MAGRRAGDCSRGARVPVDLPGLGRGADEPSREVIEAPLAHVVCNGVEAAHARSDLFERRRVLMHDWAHYLAQRIDCRRQVQQGHLVRGRPS